MDIPGLGMVGTGGGRKEPIWIPDPAPQSPYQGPEGKGAPVQRGAYGIGRHQVLLPPHYEEDVADIMIPKGVVLDRIEKLTMDIRQHYGHDEELHVLCVLKGSRGFFTELLGVLSAIHRYSDDGARKAPYIEHYVRVKSYENTESTGNVKVYADDLSVLRGKHVLIVEDIVDTGTTLSEFCKFLGQYEPQTVRVAALLEKRTERSCGFKGDFVGFSVPDVFIIGFCLDYNEFFRDLPHICVIAPAAVRRYAVQGSPMMGPAEIHAAKQQESELLGSASPSRTEEGRGSVEVSGGALQKLEL